MKEFYFLISCSEDGDVDINIYNKEGLTTIEKGDYDLFKKEKNIPSDIMEWCGKSLLIKGSIMNFKDIKNEK